QEHPPQRALSRETSPTDTFQTLPSPDLLCVRSGCPSPARSPSPRCPTGPPPSLAPPSDRSGTLRSPSSRLALSRSTVSALTAARLVAPCPGPSPIAPIFVSSG